MNIVLSCYAKKGKGCYIIEKGGRVIDKNVFTLSLGGNAHLKEYMLESIYRGIKSVRNVVSHDDLLLVGVQNSHLANWLNSTMEYKGYEYYLDNIIDIIDTIDCRYMFSVTGLKKAKELINETPMKEELVGVCSLLDEFE